MLTDEQITRAYEQAMGQELRPQDKAAVFKIVRAAMAATPAPAPEMAPAFRTSLAYDVGFKDGQKAATRAPADLYARLAEAHDASLDDDHRACRVILTECMSKLAATPAPAEPAWIAAFDEARDAILNDRGPLEGEAMSDTQTNAVLSILDDAFMPHLKREQP